MPSVWRLLKREKKMRKMASIQRVAEIRPIENSDNLDHYRINGWWVVDKKGAHQVGDFVVYCEIVSTSC